MVMLQPSGCTIEEESANSKVNETCLNRALADSFDSNPSPNSNVKKALGRVTGSQ